MKKKVTKKAKKISLSTYILLDRTGSMSTKWDETLSSVNAYVKELKKGAIDNKVTIAMFDNHGGLQFDIIRDRVSPAKFQSVTIKDASPRGDTPLYDAVGRIVALAEKNADKKTVIVVMTDGQENASKEMTGEQAKAALQKCKDKNWQVVFLGADFDAEAQGRTVGISVNNSLNISAGNYAASMRSIADKSALYATADCMMMFSASDKLSAAKKNNK